MDQKSEQMFACGDNAPGCVAYRSWSWQRRRACRGTHKKKKKKIDPLYIIPQIGCVCQEFFEKFFCKICVKFGLSSLEIKIFLWYNRIGGGHPKKTNGRSPPQPPDLLLYHKGAAFVKCFCEIFFKKFLQKVLHYFFTCDIIYI